MAADSSPHADRPTRPRASRAPLIALLVIALACAAAIIFRDALRVRWWSHRLVHAHTPQKRTHYLGLLMTAGDDALPAAESLACSDDPALRTYAIAIAAAIAKPSANDLLIRAASDADETVQRNAILSLARRGDAGIAALRRLAEEADPPAAQRAVFALGLAGTPVADAILLDLARGAGSPAVRAEAIQALATVPPSVSRDTLIDCLQDDATFAGPMVFEQEAMMALGAAAPQRAGEAAAPVAASNAARAARILYAHFGQDFGDPDAVGADRAAIQAAWRQWAESGAGENHEGPDAHSAE
jgi:HEAT repeat protein